MYTSGECRAQAEEKLAQALRLLGVMSAGFGLRRSSIIVRSSCNSDQNLDSFDSQTAGSFFGGFRTPARVLVAASQAAGIRNPCT
jgi:hypothetical protein